MNFLGRISAIAGLSWFWAASGAEPALVLTQIPRSAAAPAKSTLLDAWYPAGTRLVSVKPPFAADHARVLSQNLEAAGSPVVSHDGERVAFVGREAKGDWQIYEVSAGGGRCRRVTSVPGGAAHPALLPDGAVVFAAPANHLGNAGPEAPQLFVQANKGQPRQLTFLAKGASDPTVLLDGRILFVSAQPSAAQTGTALYTINNDGTEVTAFACQHDAPALLYSPRELNDRRVAFLASAAPEPSLASAEAVRAARPFASRASLLPNAHNPVRSVQPSGSSNLLVCAQAAPDASPRCAWACFRVRPGQQSLGTPLLADSAWDTVEAVELAPSPRPMGRLSNMDPAKSTGQVLCLDVNDTTIREGGQPPPKAARVRITSKRGAGALRVLGEVAVQADGSFMAEVPADVPIGFEALDEQGKIVRREDPSMWVRAGENRACVGCHAAHNRAPRNQRPLAVRMPVPKIPGEPEPKLAGNLP